MQRWEYCEVYGHRVRFWEASGGRDVAHPDKGAEQIVAELGLDGWEAYAVFGDTYPSFYFLKRPIGG